MSTPIQRFPPTQDDSSVQNYFKVFKMYALSMGKSIDDADIRAKFIAGLKLDNKKEAIRFGIKKPLVEIVAHLERFIYRFGEIVQGNDSALLFYAKIRKYNRILNLDANELKHNFLRGLNSENALEAERCGVDLPLEELVSRLDMLEKLN